MPDDKATPDRDRYFAILEAFRKADTIDKVNALVRAVSTEVQLLDESTTYVWAIHIKNMARYRRNMIRQEEWERERSLR